MTAPKQELALERATPDDIPALIQLRERLGAWVLETHRLAQWSAPYPQTSYERDIAEATLYVLRGAGEPPVLATITLNSAPEVGWPDDDRSFRRLYVHRLGVNRSQAGRGLGRQLLVWAEHEARIQGARTLRLDCDAANARLRRYYADLGFEACGEQWHEPYRMTLALFEKRLF